MNMWKRAQRRAFEAWRDKAPRLDADHLAWIAWQESARREIWIAWIWPAGLIGAALLVHLLQRWGWL